LPPKKQAALTAYDNEWFRIIQKSKVRSARLDLGRINATQAAKIGLTTESWRQEIMDAIAVDPIQLRKEGMAIGRALKKGDRLRISQTNGTDLELRLKGRRPRVHDGVVDKQDLKEGEPFEFLPSGWVAVAPDEHHAEGEFVANVRTASGAMGEDVDRSEPAGGGRWTFRQGKLTKFSYEEGGDAFAHAYNRLKEGKERPGAINIGLNPKIDRLPNMEDQHRGRITLMLGRNSFLDGANQTPYFHAYLSVDGATVTVDDEPIIENGRVV
jgi:leucyl aminopeptidase (aminopeptidase T)